MSIHSGDPRERRLLVLVLVMGLVVAAIAALALWEFRDRFMLMFATDQEEGVTMAQKVMRGLTLLIAAQALAACWWLSRKAHAVRTAQRFPLPGSRTVLSLRVREGAEAVRLGTLGLVVAALFGLLGAGALWLALS